MIFAAISFAISGSYVTKNSESTQIILEDQNPFIYGLVTIEEYSIDEQSPFEYHKITIKQDEPSMENNTWLASYNYTGIYVSIYDGDGNPLIAETSEFLLSYTCLTRDFSIVITQMSSLIFDFQVELYTKYFDARANLWYLFAGFVGIWAICTILLFVFRIQKNKKPAK